MKTNETIILGQVLHLLSEYSGLKISENSGNLRLVDDLGLDSFSMVEIIYELEMKFHIKVNNEDLKKLIIVQDVINLAEGNKN